jgi:long-chain fatty acid transport protein
MTRLEGTQMTAGLQALYGDVGFTIGQGTSPGLGNGDGGNSVSWFPGGGGFVSYSVSPDLKLGFAGTGNFGLALNYDSDWVGRYYVQEGALVGLQFVPSVAYRVNPQWSVGASLNAMYGKMRTQVAINNLGGADGMLVVDDYEWGFGGTLGVLYEPTPRTRFGLVWNSQIKLDFSTTPEFTGLSRALETVITNRGLNNTNSTWVRAAGGQRELLPPGR